MLIPAVAVPHNTSPRLTISPYICIVDPEIRKIAPDRYLVTTGPEIHPGVDLFNKKSTLICFSVTLMEDPDVLIKGGKPYNSATTTSCECF